MRFLRENYPNIDVDQVQVLIPGQKPWISIGSWLWLGFGAVVTIIGAGALLTGSDD